MTKNTRITCLAYDALFASTVLLVLDLKGKWLGAMPPLGALAVTAVAVLGFIVSRRRSLLSYAFGFVPAMFLLGFFLTGAKAWALASLAFFVVYALVYNIRPARLPEPRFTTQKWVSALILSEVMLVLILLLILR